MRWLDVCVFAVAYLSNSKSCRCERVRVGVLPSTVAMVAILPFLFLQHNMMVLLDQLRQQETDDVECASYSMVSSIKL